VEKEVLEEIQQYPFQEPSFYKSKKESPALTIYDMVTKDDNQGMSLCVMDVKEETHLHLHGRMVEIFVGVHGTCEITIDETVYKVSTGDVVTIPPKSVHKLRPIEGSARVIYISFPAWAPEEVQIIN
jgi:mannose-6-phosphate isomerase-like protein (cupin superfamily)